MWEDSPSSTSEAKSCFAIQSDNKSFVAARSVCSVCSSSCLVSLTQSKQLYCFAIIHHQFSVAHTWLQPDLPPRHPHETRDLTSNPSKFVLNVRLDKRWFFGTTAEASTCQNLQRVGGMEFCAIQELLKNSHESRNVFNTMFYCHQIDSYMEQHKIFEIVGELMVRVSIDRPDPENVKEYLCEKLLAISSKLVRNAIKLEFHNSLEEGLKVAEMLSGAEDFSIIESVNDGKKLMNSQKKPEDSTQKSLFIAMEFKESPSKQKFLRLSRNLEDETSQICSSKPKDAIDIQLPNDFFHRNQLDNFFQYIRRSTPKPLIKVNWNLRVLMVGRLASGRRTQGILLAKEFGLNFVDLDYLRIRYQQRQCLSKKHNLGFWGYLQETLLKPDCHQNGYVIVSNVISRDDLEILMETFIYRPNRVVFIHTTEKECRRRFSSPEQMPHLVSLFNYHMNLYNSNKKAFVEYFRSTNQVLHVNGNKAIQEIKTMLWANFMKWKDIALNKSHPERSSLTYPNCYLNN